MKTLLVTSQITYMPDNYQPLLSILLNKHADKLAGLVLLQNMDISIWKSAIGLYFLGAKNISKTLVKNIFEQRLLYRENQFKSANLPVLKWNSMNDTSSVEWVKENNIDLIINLRTRCIYKSAILNAPKIGSINIHHGLLPRYRGTLCDLYALYENRPAGFSIHQMTKQIDAGKIIKVVEVSNGNDLNYLQYLKKTEILEAQALGDILKEIKKNNELPQGKMNFDEHKIYTKNPTRSQISAMLKKGMIL